VLDSILSPQQYQFSFLSCCCSPHMALLGDTVEECTHPRECQPPRQAAKVPFATDVGPSAQQHIQPHISRHLQEAVYVRVPFPVVLPRTGLVQIPGDICLHTLHHGHGSTLGDATSIWISQSSTMTLYFVHMALPLTCRSGTDYLYS
jgi:hypothetical protein